MHTMKQWEVHFHIGYLDMPGFKGLFGSDRVPMGYMTTEQAPTRKQAIEQATVKALDFDSRAKLHKITELHSFAVTAKGKKDKRRRETVYITAQDAAQAEQRARNGSSASALTLQRFGGYGKKLDITKVEQA